MVATRTSVVAKLCEEYGVDKETALGMIEYDKETRSHLNRIGTLAAVSNTGKFQFQDGIASTVADTVKEGSQAIPVVGSIVSFIAHLATLGIRKLEAHSIEKDVAEVNKMNPSGDQNDWCSFTKDLSADMVARRIEQIRGKSREEIKQLAKKDSASVIESIFDGKATAIDDENTIPNLAKAAIGRSSQKPSASCSEAVGIHVGAPLKTQTHGAGIAA